MHYGKKNGRKITEASECDPWSKWMKRRGGKNTLERQKGIFRGKRNVVVIWRIIRSKFFLEYTVYAVWCRSIIRWAYIGKRDVGIRGCFKLKIKKNLQWIPLTVLHQTPLMLHNKSTWIALSQRSKHLFYIPVTVTVINYANVIFYMGEHWHTIFSLYWVISSLDIQLPYYNGKFPELSWWYCTSIQDDGNVLAHLER